MNKSPNQELVLLLIKKTKPNLQLIYRKFKILYGKVTKKLAFRIFHQIIVLKPTQDTHKLRN